MNKDLTNHLTKCRCCFKSLKNKRKRIKIDKSFKENFLKFVGIELEESPSFSSIVCDVCKGKIDNMVTNCERFVKNQKILNEYVKGKQGISDNSLNLKQELEYEEATMDPFEVTAMDLEEVVVKVEKVDDEYCGVEDKLTSSNNTEVDIASVQLKPCYVFLKRSSSPHNDPRSSSDKIHKEPIEEIGKYTKKIVCRRCGAVLDSKLQYNNHLREHRAGRKRGTDDYDEDIPKPCPFCGQMLKLEGRSKHFKRHENEINNVNFICDICGFKSPSRRKFSPHMRKHLSLEDQSIQCRFCSQKFFDYEPRKIHEVKMHPEMHPETQKRVYKCEFCDRSFNSYSHRSQHRRLTHLNQEYPCGDCEKVFKTQALRTYHWKIYHKPMEPCEICGIMTARMWKHKRSYHYQVVCKVKGCGKEFTSEPMYRWHMAHYHSKTEHVGCDHCGKIYDNKHKLKIHILQTHGKSIICQVPGCRYKTPRREYLKLHYRNHKGIDEAEKLRLLAEFEKTKKIFIRKSHE